VPFGCGTVADPCGVDNRGEGVLGLLANVSRRREEPSLRMSEVPSLFTADLSEKNCQRAREWFKSTGKLGSTSPGFGVRIARRRAADRGCATRRPDLP